MYYGVRLGGISESGLIALMSTYLTQEYTGLTLPIFPVKKKY